MEVVIFNSWQSDSEFNRKAISDALRLAIIEVEKKFDDLQIRIDESNSNSVGTNHIPNSILMNIRSADIFVGDLSLIGQSTSGKKKIPNPNVLIELGYSINVLTWNRIIILVNKESGTFQDLPFDLEKRNCLDFRVTVANDSNGIGQLKIQLIERITAIIKVNPPKAIRDGSEGDKKKRESDIKTLTSILRSFRVKTMDDFFKTGYKKIDSDIPEGYRELKELMSSKAFIIFDEEAKSRINNFRNKLDQLPQLLDAHYDKKRHLGYENKANKVKDGTESKKYESAKQVIQTIDEAFSTIYEYIRQYYHEIEADKFYQYKFEDPDEELSN